MASLNIDAQIFPNCPDSLIVESDLESCESVVPDFSNLADLPLGYTFSQDPTPGTILSTAGEWTKDITLSASNGEDTQECTFLAILEPNAPDIPLNSWTAYCYNGKIIHGQDVFRGYYHEPNLDVSSWQLWDIGVSPSWHPDYLGCNVTLDQHSVVYRRRGFPCGNYQLDILNHDNEVRLYVDETEVFGHDGFNLQHYNVFTGFLGDNSLVEFEWNEGIGGSLGVLDLILQCPTDTMLYLDENCNASMPDLRWTTCSGGTVTQSIDPGTALVAGDHDFTMTTTDITGWSESCSQTIHVVDTIAPFIDAPEELEEGFNSQCSFFIPDYLSLYSTSDNCGVASVTQSPLPGTTITSETIVTFQAIDIHGNSTSHLMTLVPVDNTPPAISCQGDLVADIGASCSFVVPDYLPTITSSDNCSTPSIQQTPAPGTSITESGFYIISFTATDDAGLVSNCSFNLQIVDLSPPILNCSFGSFFHVDENCEYLMPDLSTTLTYQDNCPSSMVLTQEPSANTPMSSLDDVTVTFTLEDGGGNSTSCSTTLHLLDTIAPVLDIATSMNRNIDAACQYVMEDLTPLLDISETCGIMSIEQTPAIGEIFDFDQSPLVVSFVVTDSSGNTAETSTEITLNDATSPSVTCPENINIYANADCGYIMPDLLNQVFAQDICSDLQSITQSPLAGETYFQSPPSSIEFLAYDNAGNSETCLTQILSFDTIAPQISSIDPVELPLDDNCLIEIPDFLSMIIAVDNCSDNILLSQQPEAGSMVEANGDMNCVITASDEVGNMTSTSVQILYTDFSPPNIECPSTFTFEVDSACAWVVVDLTDQVIVTDNCSSSLTVEQDLLLGEEIFLTLEPYTIEFQVIDGSGNQNSCSSSIILQDVISPILNVSSDISETSILGECGKIIEFEAPTSVDNCGETSIEQIGGPVSGSFFDVGTTEVTFVSTDQHGNSTEESFFVHIIDEEAPTIVCPDNIEMSTSPDECAIFLEFDLPEVFDNCGISSLTQISGPSPNTWVEPGNYTVEHLVVDDHGNEATCAFSVEIIDTSAPQITCPDNIIQANAPGLCGAFVSFEVTATDNCSDLTLEQLEGGSSGSYFAVGTHQITHRAIDSYGNESQCTFEIEVIDEEAPLIQCSWDISSTDPVVSYNLPISNDNCGVVQLELLNGLESGSTFASGSNTVEFISTDPSLNFSTCDFEVYINTPPVAVPITLTTYLNYISIDPLRNDYDPDGDPIFLESIDLPTNARLEYDNTVSYFPDKTSCLGDSIPYSIRDVHGAISSSYIKIELLCPELVAVPEGFSPNNDGINDTFTIDGLEDFPGSQINIFNEQGVRVYFSSAYKNGWEGFSNVGIMKGKALPEGKYYYVLEIKQNSLKQKGFIILKR